MLSEGTNNKLVWFACSYDMRRSRQAHNSLCFVETLQTELVVKNKSVDALLSKKI